MPELIKYTDVVIGGVTDFKNCLNIKKDDFIRTCDAVFKEYSGIKKIANTTRESISASHNNLSGEIYDGNNHFYSKTFEITHIVDRIGGGDAFMAGLIYGFLTDKDDQDTIEFAVAASSLKHTVPGDFNLVTVEEVEALAEGKNVGKLLR
jgi:2-dehydro-3-deoxygluconokinase